MQRACWTALFVLGAMLVGCGNDPSDRPDVTADAFDVYDATDPDDVSEDTADSDDADAADAPDLADSDVDGSDVADALDVALDPPPDGVALAGACTSAEDAELLGPGVLPLGLVDCGLACMDRDRPERCTRTCVQSSTGTSGDCATCGAQLALCVVDACWDECSLDEVPRASNACRTCVDNNCAGDFEVCAGAYTPPEEPEPVTCETPHVDAFLDDVGASQALLEQCWAPCWELPAPEACVAECFGAWVWPECGTCFSRFATCAERCEACVSDPWSWECRQCGGEACVEALRACTDSAFPVVWGPAPTATVFLVNASPDAPMAAVLLEPGGAPVVRRVPYGQASPLASVPAETIELSLSDGPVGPEAPRLTTLRLGLESEAVQPLVSMPDGESGNLLWAPPYAAEVSESHEVRFATGLGAPVRVRNDDGEPSGVRVVPGEPVMMRFSAVPTAPWLIDVDNNGSFESTVFVEPSPAGVSDTWVFAADPDTPNGMRLLVISGNESVATHFTVSADE